MNNVTEIKASAVPAVPKTISATQRLAALSTAQYISEYREHPHLRSESMTNLLLDRVERLCRELAGDAKGER